MRMNGFVILCFIFLSSCGGGDGTVPSKPKPPEPFGLVDLAGNWTVETVIPECTKKYISDYYFSNTFGVLDSSTENLNTLTIFSEQPTKNNVAACQSVILPDFIDLKPYTSQSSSFQFAEILSTRLNWVFSGINIIEYSANKIVVERTVNLPDMGFRVWTYTYQRSINVYKQTNRIALNNNLDNTYNYTYDSILYSKDCLGQTHPSTFRFISLRGRFVKYLYARSASYPLPEQSSFCKKGFRAFGGVLYTQDHLINITVLEFQLMMEHMGFFIDVLQWTPNSIKFVGMRDYPTILGFHLTSPKTQSVVN